ncbi:MAG TPA: IS66 family insertion sequence element accessory protein TnpB [Saprospiraceae bacterium]|nr:IS66 family insertion sequence element accessory protein TnpB [Saprospiraceae bacterium]
MIPFTSQHRYFVYQGIVDFRKSFDGLFGIIKHSMGSNPLDGNVYIFFNKRYNQIRLMVYDQGGLVLLSKRLERGTFETINSENQTNTQITWTQLMCVIQGIKMTSLQYRKWTSSP